MSFLTKIVTPALHEAAVRAGIRTGAATLAAGFILPAGLTVAFTGQWFAALAIGLALAVVGAVVSGIQSYAAFIAKGLPDPYVVAAIEQSGYVPKHAQVGADAPRGPPASSALGDAPIE